MKIGVIGTGDVGKTLAGGFLKHGHEVMIGTRTPAGLAEWASKNKPGRVGTVSEAAKFADLVVLAVKGSAALEALKGAGEIGRASCRERVEIAVGAGSVK